MSSKIDIFIPHLTKSGDLPNSKNNNIRRHMCDIMIIYRYTTHSLEILKNRRSHLSGPVTYTQVIKLANFPRKKKKAFKNQINNF